MKRRLLTSSPSTLSSLITPLAALALTILAAGTANARHLPEELTYPPLSGFFDADDDDGDDKKINEADSLNDHRERLFLSIDHTFFDRSYTGINSFFYHTEIGGIFLEQGLQYDLRRDRLQNMRHFFSVPGTVEKQIEHRVLTGLGLDWAPVVQYSSDRGGNNALATIDMGPTARVDAAGIPVLLRAGISGRRVDSLAGAFTVGESRSSAGVYGAFSIGSWEDPLPFAPVYFFVDGLGRRIENSSMASLNSAALGALRIGENDSLFMFGSVTFFNGREGYLKGSADSRVAHFIETPWRVERDAMATVGYKGDQKLIFYPSVYYSVGENTLEFLNDNRKRDERTIRQILSGSISTDTSAGLHYTGTLGFEWRNHDKLFGKEMAIIATPENIDSLEVNLWDYASFDPRTTHRFALRLAPPLWLRYDFSASRFLTEYPNYYVSGRDTITNNDDSDRRTLQHRLALEYKKDEIFRAEIFGEVVEYDLVFLEQTKSSSNRTDNTQRVGLLLEWLPTSDLLITEALSVEAKRGNFHFPEFHQRALSRPRYSRAVNSVLSALWQAAPLVGFSGEWNIKFSDYGFWYGREYMEEALALDENARVDYYAITGKSVYYTIDAAARLSPSGGIFEAGGAITVARDRNYEDGNYILTNENGLSIKPYLNAMWAFGGKIDIAAHLSHTFVVGNSTLSYWDFRLQAEGRF
ncbi:MAG: hypothetical protein LBU70_10490 [Chitinispirillales bacterium]|jgi:hypothetical protein|nr:hypothetical protein [Chitinispirillales bacterium]